MANTVKLKQSAVAGKVPATTDLELGELAVNTYDGKLFLKKKVGTTETVVDLTASAAGVASFSGGTTGLTPATASTGAVTLAGTLAVENGGTGGATAIAARDNLAVPVRGGFSAGGLYSIGAFDSRSTSNPLTSVGYAGGLRARFGALSDNNAAPWADILDVSTYGDSSGGGFNSLYMSKDGQRIIHKYAAAGATSWTAKDVAYRDPGKTWQNVTASRSAGSTYTNSSGGPRMVMVKGNGNGAGGSTMSATVSGATLGQWNTAESAYSYWNGNQQTAVFIVPNGGTYAVAISQGSLQTWYELDF